jgi:putative transcriptional regulator
MIEYKLVKPGAGKFLIAEPFMRDENFRRGVVLLTAYDIEGVIGFMLNRPSGFTVSELVPDFSNEYGFDPAVFLGGPVQTETLHFIHRLGDKIDGSVKIGHRTWWGGNAEQISRLIKLNLVDKNDIRFFMGYSGWEYTQLEMELDCNSWIVTDNMEGMIFDGDTENDFWRKIVLGLGGQYRTVANYPEDVHWN